MDPGKNITDPMQSNPSATDPSNNGSPVNPRKSIRERFEELQLDLSSYALDSLVNLVEAIVREHAMERVCGFRERRAASTPESPTPRLVIPPSHRRVPIRNVLSFDINSPIRDSQLVMIQYSQSKNAANNGNKRPQFVLRPAYQRQLTSMIGKEAVIHSYRLYAEVKSASVMKPRNLGGRLIFDIPPDYNPFDLRNFTVATRSLKRFHKSLSNFATILHRCYNGDIVLMLSDDENIASYKISAFGRNLFECSCPRCSPPIQEGTA